ncbi:class I SAM-dependent methyltransferase [Candidatus Woesearchaeota archaeon]|nr:class I SAM-dependent methyltransferase [Candidatus Woesearchaeota archaeon]
MIERYRKRREEEMQRQSSDAYWLWYNERYIKTYKRILGQRFDSKILDLGCGAGHLVLACKKQGYDAEGIDIETCDFENENLPYKDQTFNLVIANAVIEHIGSPDHIFQEAYRVLKPGGSFIMRTPNWQQDAKNFYNDPTHKKPYTPHGLKMILQMHGFSVPFIEPGLIEKPAFYWKLPSPIKWKIASIIPGGTKSILAIGRK